MNKDAEVGRSEVLQHVLDLAETESHLIPARALDTARLSLFDWSAVAWAGRAEPLSMMIRDQVLSEGGHPVASLFGGGAAPARSAALANGTISHALDYDDTHLAHVGHLSVGIFPAALAAGQDMRASLGKLLEAFVLGAETAIRVGVVLGREHYQRGFHQTATAGCFGATVAAGRLYGLNRPGMAHAIGLAATRASGLKSQFGTMGKPLNAGIAASNGVEAAQFARRGFTSCDDGLMGDQGFVPTHTDRPGTWPDTGRFMFEDNSYKLHACCHGTHAMIEALSEVMPVGDVRELVLRVNPRWLDVCDIKRPRTGLEVKFSYAWLAAMVLGGVPTMDGTTFTDDLARNPDLAELAARVTVIGDASVSDTATIGHIRRSDGQQVEIAHDLNDPISSERLAAGLRRKADALVGVDRAAEAWAVVQGSLDTPLDAVASLMSE